MEIPDRQTSQAADQIPAETAATTEQLPSAVRPHLLEALERWEDYRDATGPIDSAFALAELSNAMTHLRWAVDGDLEPEDEPGTP